MEYRLWIYYGYCGQWVSLIMENLTPLKILIDFSQWVFIGDRIHKKLKYLCEIKLPFLVIENKLWLIDF